MAKQDDYARYTIRIPASLYASLKTAAGDKSVNAEIIERLSGTFGYEIGGIDKTTLLMDPDLKERVQAAADSADLSMNVTICLALEEAFPPLSPAEAAVEKYNGLNRKMRATNDPEKRKELKRLRDQAFNDIAKYID